MCQIIYSVLLIRLWEPLTHCMAYTCWCRNASSCIKTFMLPQNYISVYLISERGHIKTRALVSSVNPIQHVCNLQHIMPQAQIAKFRLWGNQGDCRQQMFMRGSSKIWQTPHEQHGTFELELPETCPVACCCPITNRCIYSGPAAMDAFRTALIWSWDMLSTAA